MTPRLRTDIVDAYVFRRVLPSGEPPRVQIQILQLLRAKGPMPATWQPVMGHVEAGERATDTLWREVNEELGLGARNVLDAWALEQVHPFFIAELDAIVLSPRFAIEVTPSFEPTINDEHDDFRWIPMDRAMREALWPGQRAALRELARMLDGDPSAELLRLDPPEGNPETKSG
ncbi:MAG: NUDIX domain-containing protein [Planctomycetota bacterium]